MTLLSWAPTLDSEEDIQRLISRVTTISRGSRTDADMDLSKEKTLPLHVQEQDSVSLTTPLKKWQSCASSHVHTSTVGSSSWQNLDSKSIWTGASGKTSTRSRGSWTIAVLLLQESTKYGGRTTPNNMIHAIHTPIYTQHWSKNMKSHRRSMTLTGGSGAKNLWSPVLIHQRYKNSPVQNPQEWKIPKL